MADLSSSAVKVTNTRYNGLGKEIIKREVEVTLTGQGSAANAITAASLDFAKFEGLSYLVEDDDSAIVIGVPSADGSKLLLKAADSEAPADYSGDFVGVISGV